MKKNCDGVFYVCFCFWCVFLQNKALEKENQDLSEQNNKIQTENTELQAHLIELEKSIEKEKSYSLQKDKHHSDIIEQKQTEYLLLQNSYDRAQQQIDDLQTVLEQHNQLKEMELTTAPNDSINQKNKMLHDIQKQKTMLETEIKQLQNHKINTINEIEKTQNIEKKHKELQIQVIIVTKKN